MKKLFTAIIALVLSLCTAFAFAACNLSDLFSKDKDNEQSGQIPPEDTDKNSYKVTITGIDDLFFEPLKDEYEAGAEVEVKLSVITDVSLYVFVNEKRISQTHYDSDYWGYKFTMPENDITVYITTDVWHGVESCSFYDVFSWANYLKDGKVVKIKCEAGYIGVSPDVLPDVKYTTDKTDIENITAIFDCKLKPCPNPLIPGGYYIIYTFYTADSEYELHIDNGYAQSISFATADWFEIIGFKKPQILNPEQ